MNNSSSANKSTSNSNPVKKSRSLLNLRSSSSQSESSVSMFISDTLCYFGACHVHNLSISVKSNVPCDQENLRGMPYCSHVSVVWYAVQEDRWVEQSNQYVDPVKKQCKCSHQWLRQSIEADQEKYARNSQLRLRTCCSHKEGHIPASTPHHPKDVAPLSIVIEIRTRLTWRSSRPN